MSTEEIGKTEGVSPLLKSSLKIAMETFPKETELIGTFNANLDIL
jgi:hypothetical protein